MEEEAGWVLLGWSGRSERLDSAAGRVCRRRRRRTGRFEEDLGSREERRLHERRLPGESAHSRAGARALPRVERDGAPGPQDGGQLGSFDAYDHNHHDFYDSWCFTCNGKTSSQISNSDFLTSSNSYIYV